MESCGHVTPLRFVKAIQNPQTKKQAHFAKAQKHTENTLKELLVFCKLSL
jgi:hypothetical protein